MNTKTFLGNAVLQNFTLASFRMEPGRVWDSKEVADTGGGSETYEYFAKDKEGDPSKFLKSEAFESAIKKYIKERTEAKDVLKGAKDDPWFQAKAEELRKDLAAHFQTANEKGLLSDPKRQAEWNKASGQKIDALLGEYLDHRKAIERAEVMNDSRENEGKLKFEIGVKVKVSEAQMLYPFYNAPEKETATITELCKEYGISKDQVWRYTLDDSKLNDGDLSEIFHLPKKQLKGNPDVARLLSAMEAIKPYLQYLKRPAGYEIDVFPHMDGNKVDYYEVPAVMTATGAKQFYGMRIKDGKVTGLQTEENGDFIAIDGPNVINQKAISFTLPNAAGKKAGEWSVHFMNGHVAVAERGGLDLVTAKSGKAKDTVANYAGENTGEARFANTVLSKEVEKEARKRGYDPMEVIKNIRTFAEQSDLEDKEDIGFARGKKKNGGLFGLFGKSKDVIVFDQATLDGIGHVDGKDFWTWYGEKTTKVETGKKGKERQKFDGVKLYQERYDKAEDKDRKTLYTLFSLLDTNNDGLFNPVVEILGKNPAQVRDMGSLLTAPNDEINARTDWQALYRTYFDSKSVVMVGGLPVLIKKLNDIIKLGRVGSGAQETAGPLLEYGHFEPSAITSEMRQAFITGRNRAATMAGGNFGEYLKGNFNLLDPKKEKEAEEHAEQAVRNLEKLANDRNKPLTREQREWAKKIIYEFRLAGYLHWTDWRHIVKSPDGKTVKEERYTGIDGAGLGGRMEFEIPGAKNLKLVVDAGVGRALLTSDGLVKLANVGLHYTLDFGDGFRVNMSAGTGAANVEVTKKLKSGKEIGGEFYAAYSGAVMGVLGSFVWDSLEKTLESEADKQGLRTIKNLSNEAISALQGNNVDTWSEFYDNVLSKADGSPEGVLKGRLVSVLEAQYGKAKELTSDQKLRIVLLYVRVLGEMAAEIRREAALTHDERRNWFTRNIGKPIGVRAGVGFLAGLPFPLVGIILRRSIQTMDVVAPSTDAKIAELERQMMVDTVKDHSKIQERQEDSGEIRYDSQGNRLDLASGKVVETQEGRDKVKEIRNAGVNILGDLVQSGKEPPTAEQIKGRYPYLDSKIGSAAARFRSCGIQLEAPKAYQEKGANQLMMGIDGLPELVNNVSTFKQRYVVHIGEGVEANWSSDGRDLTFGGEVHSITATTAISAFESTTHVFVASNPHETTLAATDPARSITLLRTGNEWNKPAFPNSEVLKKTENPKLPSIEGLEKIARLAQTGENLRAYIGTQNKLATDLETAVGGVEKGEMRGNGFKDAIDPMVAAFEKFLKTPKSNDVRKKIFEAFVDDGETSPQAKTSLMERAYAEYKASYKPAKDTAGWPSSTEWISSLNPVERSYMLQKMLDAYFINRPADGKDLAKRMEEKLNGKKGKEASMKSASIKGLSDLLGGGQEDLARKIYEKVYSTESIKSWVDTKGRKAIDPSVDQDAAYRILHNFTSQRAVGKSGFAAMVPTEEAGMGLFGQIDLAKELGQDSPEMAKIRQTLLVRNNGLAKIEDINAMDTKSLLALPITRQVYPVLGMIMGVESADKIGDVHSGKLRKVIVELLTTGRYEAKDVPLTQNGKPVTNADGKAITATAITIETAKKAGYAGAYEDCTNFALGYYEDYVATTAFSANDAWKYVIPEGVGMGQGWYTEEMERTGTLSREKRATIDFGVAKCYMKSSATGPTTSIKPGLPPGGPSAGLGPRPPRG